MVNCTYNYADQYLTCDGATGSISCNSSVDFSDLGKLSFDVLSFGLKQVNYLLTSAVVKYKIFPFKSIVPDANDTDTNLVYEYKYPIYGYEIVSFMNNASYVINNAFDLICFNQLIGLLNESKLIHQMESVFDKIFAN